MKYKYKIFFKQFYVAWFKEYLNSENFKYSNLFKNNNDNDNQESQNLLRKKLGWKMLHLWW